MKRDKITVLVLYVVALVALLFVLSRAVVVPDRVPTCTSETQCTFPVEFTD